MIFAVDINNGHQWTIIDNNGQQSAVLHASLVLFLDALASLRPILFSKSVGAF